MRNAPIITYDLAPDAAPPPDFHVIHHGTIVTFAPMTVRAQDWWSDNVSNGPTFGGSYAVEWRMASGILEAARQAGLNL